MASVSVSHLIIFIAAMVVAASVAGALTTTVNDISNAIDEQGPSVSDDIRSDITIINDAGADVVDTSDSTDTIELYVKNTGQRELSTNTENIDILINGQFSVADSVTVVSNENGVWGQNDVAQVNVSDSSGALETDGENRVKVIIGGTEDTFIWEI
ncbi:MAG: flagellar protein G [Halovenus sp.]|uniref:flagellar protein G n=1 Tax=Halovenus amylolytica TaxID=2500550 RepID=UPI000FE34320